jgi:hypothetical protein
MVRGFFRIVFGYLLAVLVAGAVQVMFALPPTELASLSGDALLDRLSLLGVYSLGAATHSAIFALVFALVAIALAEWQAVRHAGYYMMTGLAIALAGFLAQYASENAIQPTIVNTYAMIAYCITGLLAGTVYWAFAGSRAGRRLDHTLQPAPDRTETPAAGNTGTPGTAASSTAASGTAAGAPATTASVPSTHGPGGRPKPLQVA